LIRVMDKYIHPLLLSNIFRKYINAPNLKKSLFFETIITCKTTHVNSFRRKVDKQIRRLMAYLLTFLLDGVFWKSKETGFNFLHFARS